MQLTRPDRRLLLWGAAVTVLLFMPLPLESAARYRPLLVRDLINFGHPLAFAWLAHLVFVALRVRFPVPSAAPFHGVLAAALGYGLLTEAVQGIVGRDPSLQDLINDLLGAAFAMLLHARAELALKPAARSGLASLSIIVALLSALPLLSTLGVYALRATGSPLIWRAGNPSLGRVAYRPPNDQNVLVIFDVPPDWRSWNYLEVVAENPQAEALPLFVRVQDRFHLRKPRERFITRFVLPAHSSQTLRVPLREMRDHYDDWKVDLGAVGTVMIISEVDSAAKDYRLQEVRLGR